MRSWWIPSLVVLTLAAGVLHGEDSGVAHSISRTQARSEPSSTARAESPTLEAIVRRHGARAEASGARPAQGATELETSEAERLWAALLDGNRRFAAGTPSDKGLVRTRRSLLAEQHPKAMVLACSDSRTAPELVFDQGLGELFVVRSAGHVAEPTALGSLEYAAEHLHPKLLVVLGHDNCGAVAAAASDDVPPTPALQALVARIRPALDVLRPQLTGPELARAGVKANVSAAAADLLRESATLRRQVEAGELTLIQAVYHLESGRVIDIR